MTCRVSTRPPVPDAAGAGRRAWRGEVAMAFLLPAPGIEIEQARFLAWCREQMANYKVPRRVRVLESMPLNAAGKVTKNVLREWAGIGAE
nr:hypothetical protein [Pseudomonas fluorescens]